MDNIYNIYEVAKINHQLLQKIFFNRVYILRNKKGLGRVELMRRMKEQGCSLSPNTLYGLEKGKIYIPLKLVS